MITLPVVYGLPAELSATIYDNIAASYRAYYRESVSQSSSLPCAPKLRWLTLSATANQGSTTPTGPEESERPLTLMILAAKSLQLTCARLAYRSCED